LIVAGLADPLEPLPTEEEAGHKDRDGDDNPEIQGGVIRRDLQRVERGPLVGGLSDGNSQPQKQGDEKGEKAPECFFS